MYENNYGLYVDIVRICDRTKYFWYTPYGLEHIHVSGLDRKTYITKEQFNTYCIGTVRDSFVSISKGKVIGDVAPLTIGNMKDWTIWNFTREEQT